ncbi:MAG: homoserine dehydrogenase [Phycisphaerales bacterium]
MSALGLEHAPPRRDSAARALAGTIADTPAAARLARVVLLGCGTVGSAVARRLIEHGDRVGVHLSRVLVRDARKPRGIPRELLTESFDEAFAQAPDLVIELLGGAEPAASYVREALRCGVPVVTANKTLVAHHAESLEAAARQGGARLYHEAAVCAGIPVFAALRHLRGDRVRRIGGVVSGSCNFILSRLSRGVSYDTALHQAASLGLVEPDPSADVSGRDSAEKLVLLARAAGAPNDGCSVADVHTTGIQRISSDDILAARRSGHVVKLIAEYDARLGTLRVGPTFVHNTHLLAGVSDEENAVVIETDLAGEIVLRGKGAGPLPTASAILGDVVRALTEPLASSHVPPGGDRAWSDRVHRIPCPPGPAVGCFHARVQRRDLRPDDLLGCLCRRGLASSEVVMQRDSARVVLRASSVAQVSEALSAIDPSAVVYPIWRRGITAADAGD